ncbi:ankyrin repeat-containing domain protein [Trichoderma camerunense]
MDSRILTHDDYTVGWICALSKEMTAARAMLDEVHPDLPIPPGDHNIYCLGSIGVHNIAIACLPLGDIGNNSAATVASRMPMTFRSIRFGLMVGIGGGVPSPRVSLQLGDVVVSMPGQQHGGVLQWDFGKSIKGGGFQRTGSLNRPPAVLMSALSKLKSTHDLEDSKVATYLASMVAKYPKLSSYTLQPRMTDVLFDAEYDHVNDNETCDGCDPTKGQRRSPRDVPAVHYGTIASGNKVIKDGVKRDKISKALGGVLCFEMEAAGLQNHFQCVIIRGICDYADSHKNDEWQGYAAATAAAFAKELLMVIPGYEVANTRTVKEAISEAVRSAVQAESQREQHNKCLQAFRTSNYEMFKARNPDRVNGTCQWFLEHPTFIQWRDSTRSSLLWVSADPGCGKSVLAKSLVDSELAASDSRTTCYFFFKNDDPDQRSVVNGLCAILHQLLSHRKPLLKHAMPAFDENGPQLSQLFDKLWGVLTTAVADPQAGEVICIMDGLDECEREGLDKFVQTLTSFFQNVPSDESVQGRLKLLITCRPYYDIERLFRQLVTAQPTIRLSGEAESASINREIDLVIKIKSKEIVADLGLPESAGFILEKELLKITHRTYLWLKLIVDMIYNNPNLTTEKKLQKAIGSLPKTVDDAYESILTRSTDVEKARKLLHIVIGAARPLTLQELGIALAVDEEEKPESYEDLDLESEVLLLTRVKNLCGLLITVVDSKIYLIHETARSFLVEPDSEATAGSPQRRLRDSRGIWKHTLSRLESNLVLAKICLSLISFSVFADEAMVIEAEQGYEIRKYQEIITQYAKDYPFLRYSAENWAVHLRVARTQEDLPMTQMALNVCNTQSPRFLTWFRIYWLATNSSVCPPGWTDLMACLTLGLDEAVRRLLDRGDVDVASVHTDTGLTPLMWAAEGGHERLVELLLGQDGVRPEEAESFWGRTPIWWAAAGGHDAVLRLLLQQPTVDPDAPDTKYGRTPLSWAASLGQDGAVSQLLGDPRVNPDSRADNGRSPLSWAAGEGHEQVVALLLSRNVDTNSVDNRYGWAPLTWAAERGHDLVVQKLLALTDIKPDRGHETVVKHLLKHQAVNSNSTSKSGLTPLSWACQQGHHRVVRLLLEYGADVSIKDSVVERTPLSWAAGQGSDMVLRLLLEHSKVAENSKSRSGQTPLSWAARGGNEAAVHLLLQQDGVEPDAKDLDGRSPLSWAAGRGQATVTQLLMDHTCVDQNSTDTQGRTPLLWAARGGYDDVVRVLLTHHSILPDSKDTDGRTPLSWAAGRGHEAVVRLLLGYQGVNPESRCISGRTPLSWAESAGSLAVVRLLLRHQAVADDSQDYDDCTVTEHAEKYREQSTMIQRTKRRRSSSHSPSSSKHRRLGN